MSSAIWSCPEKEILNFPAKSLLSFFKNHQLINFVVRPKWRTVKGGSLEYIKKIINYLEKNRNNKLLLKSKIKLISSKNKKINISFNNNENLSFDKVIMATHPDQTIKLIKDLNKKSYEIINKFKYQRNIVYLHSDKSLMPKNKKIWSSWNYLSNNNNQSSVTYWMNILQNLPIKKEVFVSLNPFLVPQKILTYKKIYYDHPIFNNDTDEAQKEMITIQGKDNIYYTGAWTGYGFHEDGIKSAVDVARSLNVNIPWDNDTKK
jgi:predicted NAD/FAD-binding protein